MVRTGAGARRLRRKVCHAGSSLKKRGVITTHGVFVTLGNAEVRIGSRRLRKRKSGKGLRPSSSEKTTRKKERGRGKRYHSYVTGEATTRLQEGEEKRADQL